MPSATLRPCAAHGCSGLTSKRFCEKHGSYADRSRANSYQRGYDRRWARLRRAFLWEHPLCADPLRVHQEAIPAAEVHHVVKHNGDAAKLYDWGNLMSLCKACHSVLTARGE